MQIEDVIKKIARGTTEIINVEGLKSKLHECSKFKRKLRVKAGFDPTAPDLHLGHVVLLNKLRQLQDLGHQVFFLIGDFTAQIGDPSGRDQLRYKMNADQIAQNAKTYKSQVFKILDHKKTEVVFNSSWLGRLTAQQIIELSAYSTVAQMLARADFKQRFEQKKEISILEFIYPLLQGYDSVHLKADIELGGADQKFNLLMGRQLQEAFQMPPQVIIMTPLLEGTDGVHKMSKSLGNYIGINESPKEIFGKMMSINDDLMYRYFELLTDVDLSEVKTFHPKEAKMKLAQALVARFHSERDAQKARDEFNKIFTQRDEPSEIMAYSFDLMDSKKQLVDILLETKLVASRNEARRLINQKAISHEGVQIEDEHWKIRAGILKIGKRRFLKLIPAE